MQRSMTANPAHFVGFARRRPIAMFLVIVLGLVVAGDAALLVSGQDISPASCSR